VFSIKYLTSRFVKSFAINTLRRTNKPNFFIWITTHSQWLLIFNIKIFYTVFILFCLTSLVWVYTVVVCAVTWLNYKLEIPSGWCVRYTSLFCCGSLDILDSLDAESQALSVVRPLFTSGPVRDVSEWVIGAGSWYALVCCGLQALKLNYSTPETFPPQPVSIPSEHCSSECINAVPEA